MSNIGEVPLNGALFRRIVSDRNIKKEDSGTPKIEETGDGMTRTVEKFLNHEDYDRYYVEDKFLENLNRIFFPDAKFDRIVTERQGREWEVYLEEKGKDLIPISEMGSGLKTIMLVLGYLYLVPQISDKNIDDIVFGFEELENNLHPALQRRLFSFVKDVSRKTDTTFFISTHSSVVIDLFSRDENVQLIHTKHSRETSEATRVTSYGQSQTVLDDLDVRASDLLQSNGIIWVEGPSDRLYVNRWIQLWSDEELQEGAHYQCVFYGGRLLSHLDLSRPNSEMEDKIQILRVNRNTAILIDSDNAPRDQGLNCTKQRVIEEVQEMGGMAWVTAGREVENYLPRQAVESLYPDKDIPSAISRFEQPTNYLDRVAGKGDKFRRSKVGFAERIKPHITKEGIQSRLDLAERVEELCNRIRGWNQMNS